MVLSLFKIYAMETLLKQKIWHVSVQVNIPCLIKPDTYLPCMFSMLINNFNLDWTDIISYGKHPFSLDNFKTKQQNKFTFVILMGRCYGKNILNVVSEMKIKDRAAGDGAN